MARQSDGPRSRIARPIFALLVGSAMVASVWSPALASPTFSAKAAVAPLIQYLNDSAGTTFTLTIDNTGDVGIGAVEITRPTTAWTVIACPLAPAGWSTQRADPKCRYRSAVTAADDIAGHTKSSAFQFTATVAPGTQNITGTWTVVVSRSNQFDDKSKLKTAAPESPGLAITAYTFQILDAVVVASGPAPGSPCPAATPANHSAGSGSTQTIAICGKNRASLALTPVAAQSSLGPPFGTFMTSVGAFTSGPIAANSASSVVLGYWSNVTISTPSGTGKSIIAKIGSASNRTSPLTTLDDTCPATIIAGETCVANGGYTAIDDAPVVTSTSPANGTSNVATDINITVNFSESVDVTTSSFTLVCGGAKTFTVSGSGSSSITLNPTADLPEGTSCTVTAIANQISDSDLLDPPDHPTANSSFSFSTDSAPTVTNRSPLSGAFGVDPSTNISVTFSEPVNASLSSFTIECPSGSGQTFAVTGSGTSTITLNPTADLPASTVCTVTVLATGISDVDGGDPPDHLAANDVFSFTTLDAAPAVTTTSPAGGADHVATNTNIVVNFSESVTATTSSFTIECPSGTPESFTVSGSPGSSITLDPTANLPEGAVCTVTVNKDQISDSDGVDPPDHMVANYVFSFTTDSAPAVTTTTPADNATDVNPAADLTVNFSEPVDASASSFTVVCDSNPQTFTVSGTGTSSITLDPASNLPSTASCTVTAVAANISDTDGGDPPDHPAANSSFSFTTRDAAPSVSSTSPADGATGVGANTTIDIMFSESVTATASAFSLECPNGTTKTFTQSASPATTITLTPDASLPLDTTCTVTVHKDEISDTDLIDPPDHMAADDVFSFTVAADQAPTDISLSTSSIAENQPSGTTVGIFSTTDPDLGDTFTYSLVSGTGDTDNGSFTITGDTLTTNASFDFETKPSYSVRVRSTDSGSLFFEKAFTITVNDVNEAPTDITLSTNSIDENQPVGTLIGALAAIDPDSGQPHGFTLEAAGCGGSFPDNVGFLISGSALQTAVSFNYEVQASYTICVRTTDDGSPNLSFDKQFTITVNDVNDPPVANADSYTGAIGNTLAVVQTTGSGPNVVLTGNVVTANDTDEDTTFPHTLTAVTETNASTGGGSATINSDGSFTFLPGVGDKNQNDTFTYHVTDGTATTAGTVTVHIDDFLVWYVDNASAAATHDGRSSSPFLDLSSLNGAGGSGDSDGVDDYIFLYQGSGSYGGGIPLEATQKLFGEKHGLLVNGHQLVIAGATAPVITNAAGIGVGLANGVDVEGLNISGASGDGINGVAVTTATVGTTTAVNVSGAGGDGVDLSGAANGNISIAAPITGSAGHSVSVAGRSGGTTAFSGSISDTGTGISLSSNTGATINLSGGITASTGTNAAFAATGGGTVNLTGSSNALATTTGTALNVANTTIGASGLSFRSISSNGASSGIVLNATGSSGGLTVAGNGSAGTGGTIQNSTGPGISLTSTASPSFSWMNVQNGGDDGIRGMTVNGFLLADSTVSGNGNAVNENGLDFVGGLTGTASITDSAVTGSAENNVTVVDSSASLNLTVTGSTFSNTSTTVGNDGIHLDANGTAGITASITGSTFNHNRGDHFQLATNASATGTNSVTFSNNTLTGDRGTSYGGTDLGGGVTINTDAGSHTSFTLANNNVQGAVDSALKIDLGTNSTAGGTLSGTISGNTIGTAGTADSGSSQANGISATLEGSGTETVAITSNTVRQYANANGINVLTRLGAPTLNATITGNTVGNPGSFALNGILVSAGASSALPDAGLICAGISSNSITGAGTNGADPSATDFRVRQRFSTTVRLPGYAGSATDTAAVVAFIKGNNGSTPTGSATVQSPGGGFVGGAACPTP